MLRQFSVLLCFFLLLAQAPAQQSAALWTAIARNDVALPQGAVVDFEPKAYHSFQLDFDALRQQLAQAPREHSPEAGQPLVVQLPLANGRFERFALVESPVMAPALQARFPEIRTYSGYSLDDAHKKIRCGVSPDWGFRAVVLREDKGVEYIEPLARWQTRYYRVYDRREFPNELRLEGKTTFERLKSGDDQPAARPALPDPRPSDGSPELAAPVVLKVYRFAAACTGEFSQENGGTLPAVLAKVVDVVNKLNAIYERDLDIRLELVANNDKIIFLDPATDPYTGTSVGGWLDQNPLAMVQNLGSADQYDIGHVFAKYLGGGAIGVGSLGSCCTPFKGRGCSAGWIPYEDDFFAVIGQEIGHQWDGGHTWTYCGGTPGDFPGSACEPGSGTTIMSYSGACGSDNVQTGLGDLYYNLCSILEIRNFVETGNGRTCGTNVTTTNNPPVVTIPYPNNLYLPISTPFELTGTAVDPDGDALTYCWEEIDTGPLVPLGSPVGSTPIFRSFPPTSTPTRTFPRLQTIINNQTNKTELLPTYNRDLTFALTARDSRPGGGGIGIDTLRMKVTANAGPFAVTYPTGNFAVWNQGEYQVVTWDVANTNIAPVNCQRVNIKLSLTGGNTYTITLAENVANTGRYCVRVPDNLSSTTARIRVEAADNVFFDISNSNFRIEAATQPGFSLCPAKLYDTVCLPAGYSAVIGTSGVLGFSTPISLSAVGLPAGVTASFSPNPVQPGADAVMTLSFPGNQTETNFDFTIKAEAGALSKEVVNSIAVYFNNLSAIALLAPANGVAGQDRAPVLKWQKVPDANSYEIQVATNPSFSAGTLVAGSANLLADSFKISNLLEKGTVYYWRVRGHNECGNGAWVGPFAFSTLVDVCTVLQASDLPKNITANGTPTIESKINLPSGGIISDLNVTKVQGSHQYFRDLEVRLVNPQGAEVLLFKDKCPNY
ncbi:MAG: hypothetical protein JNK89_00435, partial [Saprospiraceae bacterium]|nr:hypothetical protein [Saprospiraceae bacterium]